MTFTGDEDRDRPLSPVSPVSPIASGAPAAPQTNHVRKTSNLNKPLPDLKEVGSQRPPYSQNHFASVPKRKPVPISKSSEDATKTPPKGHTFALPQWLNWRLFSRRKRLVVIGVVVAILLIALIIGLAVGLTVGKRHKNLPLPTSHGGPYEGDLTYYDPALGSCGITSSSSDMICAVSHVIFDAASTGSNPNANPLCGMKLRLRRDGKSVDVKVVDRCVGCKETDIDVSRSVFKKLANIDQGRVEVHWAWLENSPVAVS